MEVAQERNYDFVNKVLTKEPIDNNINEFFVKRDEEEDTMVNALIDKFIHYYRYHGNKTVIFYRDRYGDARRANNKKSYNQLAIERLRKLAGELSSARIKAWSRHSMISTCCGLIY